MAAGEYVSVGSQADSEAADLRRERRELERNPKTELRELARIYAERGLSPDLAMQVAHELTDRNALDAHARDELGITQHNSARPVQAASASAVAFVAGGLPPVVAAMVWHGSQALVALTAVSLVVLALLGVLGAWAGGAPKFKGTVRVVLLGAAAMAVSGFVGHLFHARV
jgi:VIT1/CCC1 family predicted Fe2+/Mn2+ transporter